MVSRFSGLKTYKRHLGGMTWTGLDQLLSSLSNFVISLAIARSGGAEALGLFTVAFAVYLMVFGFQRALISDPLLTIPMEDRSRQDHHSRMGLGSAVAFLIPASVLVLLGGIVTGSTPVIVLAFFIPLVCLQDFYRHLFFRQRKPEWAALLDGIWVATSIAGWVIIVESGSASVAVAVWATGGALGAFAGAWISKSLPAGPRQSADWWKLEARSLGGYLGVDRVLLVIFRQAITLGMAAILGAGDLGRYRGAEIVLGPVTLILTAFQVFILPRLASNRERLTGRTALGISALTGGMTLLGAGVLWLVSPWLVPFLYGETLDLPAILILAVGVRATAQSLSLGPMLQLKALHRGRPIATTRLIMGLIGVPVTLGVAALFGLVPMVWTQALSAFSFVVVLYVFLTKGPVKVSADAEPDGA